MADTSRSRFGPGHAQKQEQSPDRLLDKRYRIIRLLGEGGMGSVHLAEHVGLKTRVAVKFLNLELAGQEDAVRRLEQEARLAAAIRHPNIIQIFDVGFGDGGDPFLVMEYLEGESLASLLKRTGVLDVATACGVIEPALLALQAAHRKGIIHRDLKPENIFLAHQPDEPPMVKLIDFGISKITIGVPDELRTQTGSVLGTPAYMSPEQARGVSTLDHRTDLYSIGTILFEILTGCLPYSGSNFNELFANLLTSEPRSPREARRDFPVEAEPLVRKAIRKSPDERFQSATEMLEALATLPGFEKRTQRLAEVSAGRGKSSFAAGDLGQGEWHPSRARSRRSSAPAARSSTEIAQPVAEPVADEPPRRSRRVLVTGVILAAALVLAAVAFGLRKGLVPAPTATSVRAEPAATPALPAPAAASEPSRAEERTGQAQAPAVAEAATPEAKATAEPSPTKGPSAAAEPKHRKPARAQARESVQAKKARSGSTRLRQGARGTEMSEQFE